VLPRGSALELDGVSTPTTCGPELVSMSSVGVSEPQPESAGVFTGGPASNLALDFLLMLALLLVLCRLMGTLSPFFGDGEGDRDRDPPDTQALFANPTRLLVLSMGFVVGNGGTGGTSVCLETFFPLTDVLIPLSLSVAVLFVCFAPVSSSTGRIVVRTSELDLDVGSHERCRSIMDFLRLYFSFFNGTAGGAVAGVAAASTTSVPCVPAVLGRGLSTLSAPESKRRDVKSDPKSNSKSRDGTSKAGRFGKLLRLRSPWRDLG
jgi:hypothetical protein